MERSLELKRRKVSPPAKFYWLAIVQIFADSMKNEHDNSLSEKLIWKSKQVC